MGMVKMKHINIYGPEQDPQQTLEVLAKLACFHPDKDAERINAAAGAAENLYTPLLASTLGLIKDVGGDPALQEYRGRFFEYGVVKDEVEALSAQVAERGKRQAEISAKLATYAQTKTQLYHLTGLHTSVDEIFACKYLKVRFGRIPKDSYLKLPYYDDHSFTFSEYDFDGEYYWGMYFVPESHAKEVDDIFASLYFERMWVPDFVHGTPQDALAQIMTQESELQAEQKELDNMSDIAAPADIERLREYASWLNYEMQIFDMRKYVITLEHTYYISGYVPESDVERLKQGLLMVHGVKACEDDEADAVDGAPDRQPPVKLKNNWFARPFEMFITMYGLPGYGDLDPTGFVAVTYALLFGIMFGDWPLDSFPEKPSPCGYHPQKQRPWENLQGDHPKRHVQNQGSPQSGTPFQSLLQKHSRHGSHIPQGRVPPGHADIFHWPSGPFQSFRKEYGLCVPWHPVKAAQTYGKRHPSKSDTAVWDPG